MTSFAHVLQQDLWLGQGAGSSYGGLDDPKGAPGTNDIAARGGGIGSGGGRTSHCLADAISEALRAGSALSPLISPAARLAWGPTV